MTKFVCLRLAWQTMRKNGRVYLPFLLGSIIMVMMLYSISALSETFANDSTTGGSVGILLDLGYWIMLLFSIFFYFYINGFLNKNRQQEYGLFSILGLEKHHLIRILAYQTLMLLAASIVLGVLLGIVLNKLMFLLISWLVHAKVPLGFQYSWNSALKSAFWISMEFLLIFVGSVWGILRSKPLEMMQEHEAGETEPKNRWLITLAGLLFLGAGYWIALSVRQPTDAITIFFIAVILVMIGTYCLFISGSISLLKVLQANPSYYYKTRHFLNISSMKYRMKKNAVALANICLLSTMILVALSTTFSLFFDVKALIHVTIPMDFAYTAKGLDPANSQEVVDLVASIPETLHADESVRIFSVDKTYYADKSQVYAREKDAPLESTSVQFVIPTNPGQWTSQTLGENEIAVYAREAEDFQTGQQLKIGNQTYTIAEVIPIPDESLNWKAVLERLSGVPISERDEQAELLRSVLQAYYTQAAIILPDMQAVQDIGADYSAKVLFNAGSAGIQAEDFYTLTDQIEQEAAQKGQAFEFSRNVQSEFQKMIMSLFASLIFIGLFISLLILTIIVLIMYYKQISEGYEDKQRFKILQNVGLETREVKRLINQQAMWMFFLPLAAALIHVAFAFPMIRVIIVGLLGGALGSDAAFIVITVLCVVIFALIYLIIYKLTARVYYSIVANQG